MKFLVDMNLSPSWVEFLIAAGHEAAHWSVLGSAQASDAELMQWAAAHDHIVLTADLDFGAILAVTHRNRPSVVQLRGDLLNPRAIGEAVLTAIVQAQRELLSGALVSVDVMRARIRVLPLAE